MMSRRLNQGFRLLLSFVLCVPWMPLLHAAPPEKNGVGTQFVNLAVFVEGQVTFKRQGWANYTPVVFGTNLQSGDLLRVDGSSRAKVVCSDLTLHDIPAGTVGVPCTETRPVLWRPDGSAINVTRSWPDEGSFPVVLSPRKTKLLSVNPVLQWTPVTGATDYGVVVRGPQLYWGSRVSGTEIVYPAAAPRLVTGTDYKLIVQAGDRSSSEEPGLGLGFSILSANDRKPVIKQETQIEQMGLPAGPTQFLIANLYAAYGLNAEAIQKLEAISPKFKVAAVARLLGNLYLNVGLTRRAEASYLKALDLCKDEKDEEGQMLAYLALAGIYQQALGNPKLASAELGAALELANKIGDQQTAALAGKMMARLKQ